MKNTLSVKSRIFLIVSVVLLSLSFFFPLWNIHLQAPQYPEGLAMQMWLNKITGEVDIINGLNHYIGMKKINAAMFPEFSYMVYIIGLLMVLGIATVLVNRKYLLLTFCVLFIAIGVAGAVDFYRWEYDYGHNLDPHAAIKVPGMSYQPPLLGSKKLLNFTADSYPATGGIAIIISGLLTLTILILELLRKEGKMAMKSNGKADKTLPLPTSASPLHKPQYSAPRSSIKTG